MTLKITDRMLAKVTVLAAKDRYSHFIKLVADQERLWGLYHDKWFHLVLEDGAPALALWPAQRYAEAYAMEKHISAAPREIDLEFFLKELRPQLESLGVRVAIFPTVADCGLIPTGEQLHRDIRTELENYE